MGWTQVVRVSLQNQVYTMCVQRHLVGFFFGVTVRVLNGITVRVL